ncbi:zf-HC2 domain-containing protein [Ectopseudomonas mendocina]|uniref:anti-sigma factor family protein n=1 Tax=Ectopseudomonas oleovorans TaxID=301 RepID=UPI0011C7F1AB|nr:MULTISPECIES: zf-HC2 domain-containing protein [Pseudomonas aeruginosa group]MDG9979410.1 zf-HC2 domain-containing protein [Pseudomonas oleovorans]TXR39738.1 zf-HC2 domain-containing protein [Pseudomonas mendocina]
MLTCKELVAHSSDYLDGQLTLRQRLAVRAHLAMCGNCRRFIRQMKLTQAVIRQMPEEELLTRQSNSTSQTFTKTIKFNSLWI